MKWKSNFPEIGDTRVKIKFLLLPRDFKGDTRWLERAKIVEEYRRYRARPGCPAVKGWVEIGYGVD